SERNSLTLITFDGKVLLLAEVVELADAADSKSAGVESPVRVRFPPSAPEEG
ncbi:MAG: hypothetical protein PWQ24_1881, partial [Mesotoga sp.]|nr:hypothetical protein [Mesotoga sp.]